MPVVVEYTGEGKFNVQAKERGMGTFVLGTKLMLPDVAQAIAHYYRTVEHGPRHCPVCLKHKENRAHI